MKINFENFFNHLTQPAIYIDAEGNLLFSNKSASKLFDIQFPSSSRKFDFWSSWLIYGEDGEEIDYIQNPSRKVIFEGRPINGTTLKLIPKTNHTKEILLKIDVIPNFQESNSEIKGTFVLCEDITFSRRLEHDLGSNIKSLNHQRRDLEKFINAQTSFIVRTDLNGKITFANRSYLKVFKNVHTDKRVIGELALDSVMSYHHEMVLEKIKECISNPISIVKVQMDKPIEGGGILHTIWDFKAILDDLGNPVEIMCIGIDNTERVKMQEKLIENEEKYRSLVESSDGIIILLDLDGFVLFANENAKKLSGKSLSKSSSSKFDLRKLFPKDKQKIVFKNFQKIAETKTGINEIVEIEIKGETHYLKASFQPVFGENKNLKSILINASDITQEIEYENRIKRSEANFKTLFYDSPQAYLVIQDEKFVECNRASEELMNASREHIINMPPAMISPEFQPNGRLSSDLAREYFDILYEKGKFNFEWVHLKVTGEPFLAEINLVKTVYKGKDSILVMWKDITEKKKNQQLVNQLSQIVNQSPLSVVMTDKQGVIQYINNATINLRGFSEKDVLGQKPGIWAYDRNEKMLTKDLWQTISKGNTWSGQFKNRTKKGDLILESATIFPILNEQGEIENYVSFQEDITEKLIQDEELKLFKQVFDNGVNGRLITDMDGKILYCNQFYAEMHELTKESVLGKNCVDQLSDESVPQYMVLRKRLLAQKLINSTELEHKRNEGQVFPTLINASIILDQQGNDQYISISVIDITERKKIENEIIDLNLKLEEKVKERTSELMAAVSRLETFFEVSLDMLCIADQQGHFIKLSKAFEDVLHYKRSELEGAEFLKFVHEEDVDSTVAAMNTLQNNRRVIKFVNRYRTKEGEYRFIEWYSSPVGNFVYAVARDVTQQKQKEEELILARKSAEEANTTKSNFLSRMSHELRTPMNSILGFAQLLEMGELDETQHSSVQHILTSGKHLLHLINEVLDISRIEAGNINLSIEPVNVTNSIKSVYALVAPLADANRIQLILDKSTDYDLVIRADNLKVNQILTNLISNAIKYNKKEGKVYVSQELRNNTGGETMIRVSVKDTGIGISTEDQVKIFNPFERLSAQNSSIEGTGLGLAVTKELVQALGGKIGLESIAGEGTTFWFEFPKCTSEDVNQHIDGHNNLEKKIVTQKMASVVYIEDNEMNLNLVKDIFKFKLPTYDLNYSTTGQEGIKMVSAIKPDLILLDLDLPDIHGSEVLKVLKKDKKSKDIPVIIVSANATEGSIQKLKKEGAVHYVTKPIDINQLLELIQKYINH